jgi:apolipoprotein N-acyltransferase
MKFAPPTAARPISATPVRLAAWCREAGSRSAALAAFAAGSGSVLAMAPFFLWPVLFVALPILVWLIDRAERAPANRPWRLWLALFAPGWWFGFGYFVFGLFWIGEAFLVEAERFLWALPFALTLLPAGLAIFFGAATAVAAAVSRPGLNRVVALALTLSVTEWLRGHIMTGFPWNTLGYALTMPLQLMQSAAVIGIYGLTLAAVLIFAAPAVLLAEGARLRSAIAIAAVPLLLMVIFGVFRLALSPESTVPGVRLRLVQPSVPQREKWVAENQRWIFFAHIDLSKRTPDGVTDDMAAVTHVIWPEAAMPFRPLQSPEALAAIGEMLPAGKFLLSGGLRTIEPPAGPLEARNSLMVIGHGGEVGAIYDKIHLVPFGEYVPLRPILDKIGLEQVTRQRGGFGIGVAPRPLLVIPGLPPVGPLICYEAIFPAAVVQGVDRPGLLVNITNDGWFGNTTGPRQHLHQARVRAVEEGLPLVRAANNGISAMIAPSGRITGRLDLNVRGSLDVDVPRAVPPPVYARFGDFTFAITWLLCACLFVRQRENSQHSR